MTDSRVPVRAFISYAHDDEAHTDRARDFWLFLRANGVDARLDLGIVDRTDFTQWMDREVRDADFVLVVASPDYKRRAEGDAEPDEGRGVQWEARRIRDRFYTDQDRGMREIIPVVLPGDSAENIPGWLAPHGARNYQVTDFTVAGAEDLLRVLTAQPGVIVPPVGPVPTLPPKVGGPVGSGAAVGRPGLHTEVVIEAARSDDGELESVAWVAGTLLSHQRVPWPAEAYDVWPALMLPPLAAGDRMVKAGKWLAQALLSEAARESLGNLLDRMTAADTAEVVLSASGAALSLPVELMRLRGEAGPLGLLAGVSVMRRPLAAGRDLETSAAPASPSLRPGTAGPLKVLAAVAAPDATKTKNPPLDTEAEMAAVLDVVADVAAAPDAQVRILEVASLGAIRQALASDAYHVLHLSAHGSPDSVELEDEDGAPVTVSTQDLMQALKHSGQTVPLIMLSSCSGGARGTQAMAASLLGQGADRVIAMLAPVTDGYATTLARFLYRELVNHPALTVGQALGRARFLAEEEMSKLSGERLPRPEYGVATLLAAGADGPLIDSTADPQSLPKPTTPPGGKLVRDLPMGSLIGRRAQMRDAMAILRRTSRAVDKYGAASGVVLTGIGGIGKTALAGRIMSRLADDGWLIVVHEGRWNPTALINDLARALREAAAHVSDITAAQGRANLASQLADPAIDDGPKMGAVAELLRNQPVLLVFDDFEQNLTGGGEEFLDPSIDEMITNLADAAETGALLITCRYPLPGDDRFLIPISLPPLSAAELRRLFLRLPALRDLDDEDRRLLMRTIGGHPRLIEFTDALLRGGHANFRHVQTRLRELARAEHVRLRNDQSLETALDQAMLLGSADILLNELLILLNPAQVTVVCQVAVSRAPMSLDDLAFTLAPADSAIESAGDAYELAALAEDIERLTDLTLLSAGQEIAMNPWTAELVIRNANDDSADQHERALSMRYRRLDQKRGRYEDLIEIPRHTAALARYDEAAGFAAQIGRMLPGTLATIAYLDEILAMIPADERAWTVIAELEAAALLDAGDLSAATSRLNAIHQQDQARVTASPANNEWQRDLSVSHNKLGNIAVAAGDLNAARTAYQAALDIRTRLAGADPANTQWQRDLSVSHNNLGNIAVAAGDLNAARTAYQAALDIAEQLAGADPANTQWQRDLSISHDNLGNIAAAAGDLNAARTAYQAALNIRTRLAAADPANTQWQRDLSISHDNLGNIAAAAGDLNAARTAYQASLDIAEHLAAADPANTEWQRDLSVSHDKLGDVAAAAGDTHTARTHYQASLDIRTRLAAADPANTEWQRDLSVSHDKLGDVAAAAGDLNAARTAYQAALNIRTRLAAADPANTQWQRDLSVSHDNLGNIAAGDTDTARTTYQAALDIRTRLAGADPANTEWQRDLSVSHDNLGDIAAAAGDLNAARTAYQAALNIRTRLAAADPANTQWQRDLSVSHNKLGNIAAGDTDTARTAYQAALNIRTRLAAADPANTEWQRDLSISHDNLGDIAAAAGDTHTARTHYQASLDIRTRLAAADPANTEWQRDLSVSHNKLGGVAAPAGDLDDARTHFQASLDIAERLAAADPANTQWQRDLSVSHDKLGDVAATAGDTHTARTYYQASMDIRTRLVTADPANAQWQRDLEYVRGRINELSD